MVPSIVRYRLQFLIVLVRIVFIATLPVRAESPLTPHPALQLEGQYVTKQLGDFGESFVDAGLRARGFEVIDGNIGGTGIDRIAVRRAANGGLTDIRFIEVKTRQAIPNFELAVTK